MASSTSWDFQVVTNVTTGAQPVRKQNFGLGMHATEEVEAGFTELYRLYESNNQAQADDDLSVLSKAAAATFYSQPASKRPRQFGIAKVTYASLSTDLTTLLAAFSGFYGVTCESRAQADVEALAAWVLANERIGGAQSSDAAILAGTADNAFEEIFDLANGRCWGVWADDDAEHQDVAEMAQGLSTDMDTQSSVWYDTQLVGLTSADVTVAERNTVTGYGGNLLLPKKGVDVISLGTMFNVEFIDVIVLGDWFKARSEEAVVQLQLDEVAAGSKVPFTNHGIGMIEDKIRGVYSIGVAAGHFRETSLVMDVPDISTISSGDLASRSVTLSATIIRAGALQNITLNVGIIAG